MGRGLINVCNYAEYATGNFIVISYNYRGEIMIEISGIVKKRGNLSVIMVQDEIAKKEKFKDGQKVSMIFKK